MTSTDIKIGMTGSTRPSSRVLKPPGGGHTNIFAEPELAVNAPRPKYNQQNSSNMNDCIGSTDANKVVEKLREELVQPKQDEQAKKDAVNQNLKDTTNNTNGAANQASRGRVPPGGYSSGGFW